MIHYSLLIFALTFHFLHIFSYLPYTFKLLIRSLSTQIYPTDLKHPISSPIQSLKMKNLFGLFLLITTFTHFTFAQTILEFQSYQTGFSSPVDIANAGDGSNRLFIVEKGGMIKIIKNGSVLPAPFLNISSFVSSSGERGLLGLAFHPNYSSNGFFYVNYTDTSGDTRIVRFGTNTSNADLADPTNRLIMMTIAQPFSNHNAGDLEFGPDGYLYIPMGDGGSANDPGDRSQNPQELLGKMLRIDVDGAAPYAIPPSNPFVGNSAVLDEIWAIGLRNPWRFSFDRLTGDIWIADVGQIAWEEVSFQPAASAGGENYGWRCYEGNVPKNLSGCGPMASYTFPIFVAGRSLAQSITGGYVYRGTQYPGMVGKYICCDFASDNCWTIEPNSSGGWTSTLFSSTGINSCTTFGEAENGELYAASISGTIYETTDVGALPVELSYFEGQANSGFNTLNWTSASEENTDVFELQRSSDATRFRSITEVKAAGYSLEEQQYQYIDRQPFNGANYYRLKMVDQDGSFQFSKIIQVDQSTQQQRMYLHPNPSNGKLNIHLAIPLFEESSITIYDIAGRKVFSKNNLGPLEEQTLNLSSLTTGLYLLTLSSGQTILQEKLLIRSLN